MTTVRLDSVGWNLTKRTLPHVYQDVSSGTSNTAFQGVFFQESDALFVGLGHIPGSCASNTPILTGQISVFGKPWTFDSGKRFGLC